MALTIKPKDAVQLDLVSLGECMIRLSPLGHGRIEFANLLEVWVGGGEYNVAYALSRLGLRTGWTSKLVDNPLGSLILNHARRWAWMCRRWRSPSMTGWGGPIELG